MILEIWFSRFLKRVYQSIIFGIPGIDIQESQVKLDIVVNFLKKFLIKRHTTNYMVLTNNWMRIQSHEPINLGN